MQPTLPPSPKTASSIFDAIKEGDWEGLLALYATTAYDAVNSAEFARHGGGGGGSGGSLHRQLSSPPSLMAAMGGSRKGVFRDGKEFTLYLAFADPFLQFFLTHHMHITHQSYILQRKSLRALPLSILLNRT